MIHFRAYVINDPAISTDYWMKPAQAKAAIKILKREGFGVEIITEA